MKGACEILGFDPLYVANEGRFVAFIPQKDGDLAIKILKLHFPENAAIIDKVSKDPNHLVTLQSVIGSKRIIDLLSREQLPRIC